jgi:hypothetical protein
VAIAASEVVGVADGVGQLDSPVIAAVGVQDPVPIADGVQALAGPSRFHLLELCFVCCQCDV